MTSSFQERSREKIRILEEMRRLQKWATEINRLEVQNEKGHLIGNFNCLILHSSIILSYDF